MCRYDMAPMVMVGAEGVLGRAFHSSTTHLNLSHFYHSKYTLNTP
jgi:hypothetical protein